MVAGRELIIQKQAATKVALERAHLDLDRTTVTSPIDGRVVTSSVEEQSFVAAGTSFVTIEDTASVEVRSNLTVDQMYRVWNSDMGTPADAVDTLVQDDRVPPIPATVQYRLGTRTYQWQATLERIDGAGIDAATRTYPCLFRVDAPERVSRLIETDRNDGPKRLMRGMFVSVQLKTESNRPLVQCSEMAIRPGNRVWLNRDGKLHIVPVEIVGREGDRVIIDAEGLWSDANPAAVVVSPVSNPSEGMKLIAPTKPEDGMPGSPNRNGGPKIADESKAAAEKAAG